MKIPIIQQEKSHLYSMKQLEKNDLPWKEQKKKVNLKKTPLLLEKVT